MNTIVAVVPELMFHVKVSDGARHAGRAVLFATDLDSALTMIRDRRAVLVVADLNCKTVDVLELVRRLKADPDLKTIPALGFVSHVQEDLKREALTAGYDKVVARSTFSDKARELLAGWQD